MGEKMHIHIKQLYKYFKNTLCLSTMIKFIVLYLYHEKNSIILIFKYI